MCDQGLQLQVEISRSRWSPEHRVPVFTQMSGTIKVRGAVGWGVGVGLEENTDRNRVGGAKGRCHVSRISSYSKSC